MISDHPNKSQYSMQPQQPPSANQKAFDPWIIWVTCRRCWPWAVPIGTLLACVVAIVVKETFVPRYQAGHWLEAREDYLVFKDVMPTVRDLARTERSLFYSQIVLGPVLADPSLRKAPSLSDPQKAEANIRSNLSLQSGGTSSRVIVSYTDTDPVAAAKIADAIAESYLRSRESFDSQQVEKLVKHLEPELRKQEQIVEKQKLLVDDHYRKAVGYAPGERLSMLADNQRFSTWSGLQSGITELKQQLAVLDAQQARNRTELGLPADAPEFTPPKLDLQPREPTDKEIAAAIENDQKVIEAKQFLQHYKSEMFSLEATDMVRFNRDHHRELQSKRDQAMADLEAARVAARPEAIVTLKQLLEEDLEQRKRQAETQFAFLEQKHREGILLEQAEKLEAEKLRRAELAVRLAVLEESRDAAYEALRNYGSETSQLQFAEHTLELENAALQQLRERIMQIQTERRSEGSVRTLQKAEIPAAPVEVIPMKKILTYSAAAFLVPFMFGFLWEFKVQRLTDSRAVENANLAPVVGEVARLPSGNRSAKGRRMFEESIDTLRSNLFLSVETKDTRSIAVVSSMSGEGKSSVASQLALSISKATGQTVLLVDTDLRCPDQHEIFGIEPGPGLCGVLSGTASLDEAVNSSLGDLIHILPAGKLKRSPHRLMSSEAMSSFVDDALESYAYVVFDTAPVLSAGETLAVASVVDATLVCVMRDVSRIDSVTRTTRRLEASGARIAGTVFSGVSARQYSYRYGDYHYAVTGDFVS